DKSLHTSWQKLRQGRTGFANSEHPFRHQGSADLNSYKMFAEVFWNLIHPEARLGILLPSSVYTDSGTNELRETFLSRASWAWLFSFENRRKIFEIDGRFKFCTIVVDRRRLFEPLKVAFMVHDLANWERSDPPIIAFDGTLISMFSPKSKS